MSLQAMKNRRNAALALAVVAAGVSAGASAALPTEVTTAFTSLTDNVDDLMPLVWAAVTTVVGAFVLLKLFKRGASKV